MKLLLTTIAAVLVVGCGNPEADRALLEAARDGNLEAVKQHLAAGADVNAKILSSVFKGDTPLDWAETPPLDWAKTETAALLRKHGGKTREELKDLEEVKESIHAAARVGHIEAVKQHLAAGADVNAKNWDGWTPLCRVAANGQKEIAELLIANGADVNAKGVAGFTPLHDAASQGRNEIAELLIAKGADVNMKNDGGDGVVPKNGTRCYESMRRDALPYMR